MRALRVEALAADYAGCVVRELATPQPGPGEVRVRVRAAAVNFPDLLMTRGEYQHKPELPFTPGLEWAGEVETLGEGVEAWKAGDAVVGAGGAFAEQIVAPAAALRAKPVAFSFAEAASFAVAYLTAYVSLARRARAQAGEWLLVHGAAGGVGLACVDLGLALGLKVIAASASDAKLAVIRRDYGPEAVLNVTGGFREKVKALTHGRGADIVYDPVGGDVFDESIRCIAFDGRLLVVGFTSGRIPTVSVNLPHDQGLLGDGCARRRIRPPVSGSWRGGSRGHLASGRRGAGRPARASMLSSRSRAGARPSSSSPAAKSSARRSSSSGLTHSARPARAPRCRRRPSVRSRQILLAS